MRIVHQIKYLITLSFIAVNISSWGQNGSLTSGNNDPSYIIRQRDYIRRSYSDKIENPKELINGKEYESYYLRSKFKPLLFQNRKRTATLFTRMRTYSNLTLQYDTYLDEAVYTDTGSLINYSFPQIALNKDVVEGFNLYFDNDSMIFRYLRPPEFTGDDLGEGFYEIAYSGKSKFLIKHHSSLFVREGLNEYIYNPENFISTGDKFHRVKSRKDLLELMGDRAPEIKKFLHLSRIRIKQADRDQLIAILKFYDSPGSVMR